jgi:hypothetical protein
MRFDRTDLKRVNVIFQEVEHDAEKWFSLFGIMLYDAASVLSPNPTMRAEIESLTEAAKQSIGLLRRHL